MNASITSFSASVANTYDPTVSEFYLFHTESTISVYSYSDIFFDGSPNPSSGSIASSVHLDQLFTKTTILNGEFAGVNPDDYGVKQPLARWVMDTKDGKMSEWYTTEATYISETRFDLVTPNIDSKFVTEEYSSTPGYINAYVLLSFNGKTFTLLDYAVYFTFYQAPTIVNAWILFGTSGETVIPYDTDGAFADASQYPKVNSADKSGNYGDHDIYVYLNGTGVFLRNQNLVCIFVQCGESCSDYSVDDIEDCTNKKTCETSAASVYKVTGSDNYVSVDSKIKWYETLECAFGCVRCARSLRSFATCTRSGAPS